MNTVKSKLSILIGQSRLMNWHLKEIQSSQMNYTTRHLIDFAASISMTFQHIMQITKWMKEPSKRFIFYLTPWTGYHNDSEQVGCCETNSPSRLSSIIEASKKLRYRGSSSVRTLSRRKWTYGKTSHASTKAHRSLTILLIIASSIILKSKRLSCISFLSSIRTKKSWRVHFLFTWTIHLSHS